MRYAFLIQICLFVFLGQSIVAQDIQPQEVDCHALIEADIEYDLEPFDYIYACDRGADCYYDEGFLCHFLLANHMAQSCDRADLFCTNQAFLSSAAIDIQTGLNSPIFIRNQSLVDALSQVLHAFSEKDFETALTSLQNPLITDAFHQHPVTFISRGLLYEMLDQPDKALQEYAAALEIVPQYAFIHYLRGLTLGRIGRDTEASFESAWLEDYLTAFAPDLLPLTVPLTETYPLDTSRISEWVKYPIMLISHSPGGQRYVDRTQVAAIPIQLGIYDELNLMLAVDVSGLRYSGALGDVMNTYVFQRRDDGSYGFDFHIDWGGPDTMNLEFRDGLIFGEEYSPGAESLVKAEFILAPLEYPDPRQSFGKPTCEGGVISRLRPGMYVMETGYNGAFLYAETPGGTLDPDRYFDNGYRGDQTDESYPWLEVRVTDHFTCIGDTLWWEVTDGLGNYGWRAENEGMEYQINPIFDLRELFYCPDAPTMRLYIRAEGRVLEGLGANNLRIEPDPDAELVGTIPEGGQFTVLDGPVCMQGMAWWQVTYGDLVGWTVEGDSNSYWVEPILPW